MDIEENLYEVVISGVSGKYPLSENFEELQENLLANKFLVTDDDCRWNTGRFKMHYQVYANMSTLSIFLERNFKKSGIQIGKLIRRPFFFYKFQDRRKHSMGLEPTSPNFPGRCLNHLELVSQLT